MVFDRNKNGWMEASIAMIAVTLVRTFLRRAHAVEADGIGCGDMVVKTEVCYRWS